MDKGSFQPDGRQRNRHPKAGEEQGRREITPLVGTHQGEDKEYGGHCEGLAPMGDLFRLNEPGSAPMWLLDAGAGGPRMVFVPAARAE